jgi:uncharacterized protein
MKNPYNAILLFVLLAYGLSSAVWFSGFVLIDGLSDLQDERFTPFLFVGSFGPTVAALIVTGWYNGRSAVIDLLKRVVQVKVNWRVYLFAFFVLPTVGILLFLILGIRSQIPLWQIGLTMIPLAPVNALFGGILFGYGPLGEEMGWRGLMQEQLQARISPVLLALIIGVVWSFWHWPLFQFDSFRVGLDLPLFILLYTLSLVLIAFIMGHLWRWSRGSLFVAIFFHAVVNITTTGLTNGDWWQLEVVSNVQLYVLVLGTFALTAILAEMASRTFLRQTAV